MILSNQKKFIFIHNYKVAGTSITNSLKKFSSPNFKNPGYFDDIKFLSLFFSKFRVPQFATHITASELKEQLPEKIFDEYFKFGFVRNPWDWQVSLYSYILKIKNHRRHDLVKSMESFDEYIDWRVHKGLNLQKDFFYKKDECIVDFIGKMENIEKDFQTICEKVNIVAELLHLNASRKDSNYLKFYSKKSIELVSQAFAEDIKLFGYVKPKIN